MSKPGYHHGDLRRAVLDAAAAVIAESGVHALSMRDLARRAGVSHAAPAHHFGDRAGLLTALATEGFDRLAAAVSAAGSFLDAGVAYVRFAEENRGHFEVMFRPGLYRADDPDLVAARKRSSDALYAGAPARVTGLAGWSIAHGFATLRLSGALPELGDPDEATRAVLGELGP